SDPNSPSRPRCVGLGCGRRPLGPTVDTDRPRAERHLNATHKRPVEMVVTQNLAAPLAHAARPDVKPHVTAIALGEEDRFLEDGHDETYRPSRGRLHVEPLLIRDRLPMLDVTT